MPNDEPTASLDAWLSQPVSERTAPPAAPTVDEIWERADLLGPDERLRLVTRLWKSLPRDHRAALVTLQMEHIQSDRNRNLADANSANIDSPVVPTGPDLMDRIFNRAHTSELYSAPRRFDLASIFVVTAAYSLLLGALSLLGSPPVVMIVVAGMIAIIATTQAMFQHVANPRGVSIITGAVTFAIICAILHFTTRGILTRSLFVNFFIIGIPCGAFLGYLMGTVVGGVFLVADMVRKKMEGPIELPTANNTQPQDANQAVSQEATTAPESARS
jgi:hypothetical protein